MERRRVAFSVSGEVYQKLRKLLETEDSSVSDSFKALAYNITDTPQEMSAVEKDKLDRIEASKRRLAEKEKALKAGSEVPSNPFLDINASSKPVRTSPFQK